MSFEWKTVFYQAGRPILWAVVLSLLPFSLFLYFLAVDAFLFIVGSEQLFFEDSYSSFVYKILSFIPGSESIFHGGSYNNFIVTTKVFVGSYIGAFIGEKLREFAFPDGIATTGFFETIGVRVFWLIGPQLLGCIIGVVSLFWWGGVTADSTPTLLKASLAIAAVFIAKREYQLLKDRSRYRSFGPSAFRRASLWLKGNWGIIAVVVAVVLLLERFDRPKLAASDPSSSAATSSWTRDSSSRPDTLADLKEKAAQGVPDAQYELGRIYHDADGVSQDLTESLKWVRKAAAQGHVDAQFQLGLFYEEGLVIQQNFSEAAELYRTVMEKSPKAQNNLGLLYENGRGVPRDVRMAANLYRAAKDRGLINAAYNLGRIHAGMVEVPTLELADELFNEVTATEMFLFAATRGHANAMIAVGRAYMNGFGVSADYCTGRNWIQRGADAGATAISDEERDELLNREQRC